MRIYKFIKNKKNHSKYYYKFTMIYTLIYKKIKEINKIDLNTNLIISYIIGSFIYLLIHSYINQKKLFNSKFEVIKKSIYVIISLDLYYLYDNYKKNLLPENLIIKNDSSKVKLITEQKDQKDQKDQKEIEEETKQKNLEKLKKNNMIDKDNKDVSINNEEEIKQKKLEKLKQNNIIEKKSSIDDEENEEENEISTIDIYISKK